MVGGRDFRKEIHYARSGKGPPAVNTLQQGPRSWNCATTAYSRTAPLASPMQIPLS